MTRIDVDDGSLRPPFVTGCAKAPDGCVVYIEGTEEQACPFCGEPISEHSFERAAAER